MSSDAKAIERKSAGSIELAQYNLAAHHYKTFQASGTSSLRGQYIRAVFWFQMSASHGYEPAINKLQELKETPIVSSQHRVLYSEMSHQALFESAMISYLQEKYSEALPKFMLLAGKLHHAGLLYLAVMYTKGYGVVKASKEMGKVWRVFFKLVQPKIEKVQDGLGYYILAQCYLGGIEVTKDIVKAQENFIKAGENGCRVSFFILARKYELGDFGFTDLQKAICYYQKSLEAGFDQARLALKKTLESHPLLLKEAISKGNSKALIEAYYIGLDGLPKSTLHYLRFYAVFDVIQLLDKPSESKNAPPDEAEAVLLQFIKTEKINLLIERERGNGPLALLIDKYHQKKVQLDTVLAVQEKILCQMEAEYAHIRQVVKWKLAGAEGDEVNHSYSSLLAAVSIKDLVTFCEKYKAQESKLLQKPLDASLQTRFNRMEESLKKSLGVKLTPEQMHIMCVVQTQLEFEIGKALIKSIAINRDWALSYAFKKLSPSITSKIATNIQMQNLCADWSRQLTFKYGAILFSFKSEPSEASAQVFARILTLKLFSRLQYIESTADLANYSKAIQELICLGEISRMKGINGLLPLKSSSDGRIEYIDMQEIFDKATPSISTTPSSHFPRPDRGEFKHAKPPDVSTLSPPL